LSLQYAIAGLPFAAWLFEQPLWQSSPGGPRGRFFYDIPEVLALAKNRWLRQPFEQAVSPDELIVIRRHSLDRERGQARGL